MIKFIFILFFILPKITFAQNIFTQNPIDFVRVYCSSGDIAYCLQGLYNLGVAIAVLLAFFMFLFGAFKNLLSVVPDIKMEGKTMMRNAIIGLVIIFLSGIILYWINPFIFDPRIIVYRVTKLEINAITSDEQLRELQGEVENIGDEFREQFPKLKNAINNTVIDVESLPDNTTVKKYIELAYSYSNSDIARGVYAQRYGTNVTSLTACNFFVYRILKEAQAVPDTCPSERASDFHKLLTNNNLQQYAQQKGFKWTTQKFNINNLQPGDILVKTSLSRGGHGHVAIVVPVLDKNNKKRLVIAHASLSTRRINNTYSGSPPRLTSIPNNFQIIVRPMILN
ncbi:MAG: pilin [Patescibacteria group bacterium]|nr:pilin [Patescibacteria group bacterium]